MEKETLLKKIERSKQLLSELQLWLVKNPNFNEDLPLLRASERNFELVVEQATDINGIVLGVLKKPISDTYKGSFYDIAKAGVFEPEFVPELITMVDLRNKMVHDYDFNEDFIIFYSNLNTQVNTLVKYITIITEWCKTIPADSAQ